MKNIILTAILLFAVSGGVHAQTVYTIDSGDKLRITVFDEESLSGDFSVGADGSVTLPLIGTVTLRDKPHSKPSPTSLQTVIYAIPLYPLMFFISAPSILLAKSMSPVSTGMLQE